MFTFSIDPGMPEKVTTSRSSFRQMMWNLLSSQLGSTLNTNIKLTVRQSATQEIVIEINRDQNNLGKEQQEEIQQICLSEELSQILKSESIDINIKIALILARQHGWPIDFMHTPFTTKFVIVVTSTIPDNNGSFSAPPTLLAPPLDSSLPVVNAVSAANKPNMTPLKQLNNTPLKVTNNKPIVGVKTKPALGSKKTPIVHP
jgi:hypothetical protein